MVIKRPAFSVSKSRGRKHLFLTLVAVSASWIVASAQTVETLYDFEENGIYYSITSENTVAISPISKTTNPDGSVSYQGNDAVYNSILTIQPEVYHDEKNYYVTEIAPYAFKDSEFLQSVVYTYETFDDEYMLKIGESAFEGCNNLQMVILGGAVIEIGEKAFFGCENLSMVVLGQSELYYNDLKSLTIGYQAFANNPKLNTICLTSPDHYYTCDNCFPTENPDLTFYVGNPIHFQNGFFGGYNILPFLNIQPYFVPYTGRNEYEFVELTPEYTSNLPGEFSIRTWSNMPIERNVGTYTGNLYYEFTSPWPVYANFSSSTNFTYQVTPAKLTIIPGNYEREYGQPNPEITINVEGYVGNDNESVFSTKPYIVNGKSEFWPSLPDATANVGEYNIYVWATLNTSNYELYYEAGTIKVTQAHQKITWKNEEQEYNVGTQLQLDAFSTSGLDIEYTSSNPDVAKIDGNVVNFLTEGELTITATQAGNENYLPAESVQRVFSVTKKPYEQLTLNFTTATLDKKNTLQLIIAEYEWTSSDENIATVSESGLITAINEGNAIISLIRRSDGTVLAACQIKVNDISANNEAKMEQGPSISILGNTVTVSGKKTDTQISIYDIEGHTVYSGCDDHIELSKGIYMVHLSGQVYKIRI